MKNDSRELQQAVELARVYRTAYIDLSDEVLSVLDDITGYLLALMPDIEDSLTASMMLNRINEAVERSRAIRARVEEAERAER